MLMTGVPVETWAVSMPAPFRVEVPLVKFRVPNVQVELLTVGPTAPAKVTTASLALGTPAGLQLVAVPQEPFAAPTQVLWAGSQSETPRHSNEINARYFRG